MISSEAHAYKIRYLGTQKGSATKDIRKEEKLRWIYSLGEPVEFEFSYEGCYT